MILAGDGAVLTQCLKLMDPALDCAPKVTIYRVLDREHEGPRNREVAVVTRTTGKGVGAVLCLFHQNYCDSCGSRKMVSTIVLSICDNNLNSYCSVHTFCYVSFGTF